MSGPAIYSVKITKPTRATRSMMYLWEGEATIDEQGFRVVGAGSEGRCIPAGHRQELPRRAQFAPVRNERQRQGLSDRQSVLAPKIAMRILSIDTTAHFGSLALLEGENVVEETLLHAPEGFGQILFDQITRLLNRHNWNIQDIDRFAAAGPGSFTGVRIGLAAAKGLAEATGKAGHRNLKSGSPGPTRNSPIKSNSSRRPPRRNLRSRLRRPTQSRPTPNS